MQSKIITSFDIGIRNLAYCILSYHPENIVGNQFMIHDWNVIDLIGGNLVTKDKICQCVIHSGIRCHNPAHFYTKSMSMGPQKLVCKVHAKSYGPQQLNRFYTMDNLTMAELAFLAITKLDQIDFTQSQEIIFESQPSKNPKMKNLSMMLFNYFIIRYMVEKPEETRRLKDVKPVSSHNKLTIYDGPYVECHLKNQHARNKFYGKVYCRHMIRSNPERLVFFDHHKKSDDLADSFLQGAWYLMDGYKGPTMFGAHSTRQIPLMNPSPEDADVSLVSDSDNLPAQLIEDPDEETDPLELKTEIQHKIVLKLKVKQPQQLQSSGGLVDVSSESAQPPKKIVLKLKKTPVGRDYLQQTKHNPVNQQIREDYQLNVYRQLQHGRKPSPNARRYTLSNIKYLLEHPTPGHKSNPILIRSMHFFFGQQKTQTLLQ